MRARWWGKTVGWDEERTPTCSASSSFPRRSTGAQHRLHQVMCAYASLPAGEESASPFCVKLNRRAMLANPCQWE